MKRIMLLINFVLASSVLQAQSLFSKKQQKVQHAVVEMFEALSNRDSVAFKNHCTNDVSFYEYGQRWNIDTLIYKGITQNQATDFARINTLNFINTETAKYSAWATYQLHSEIIIEGRKILVQWLETVVLVRERKFWKVRHLHSTLVKRS